MSSSKRSADDAGLGTRDHTRGGSVARLQPSNLMKLPPEQLKKDTSPQAREILDNDNTYWKKWLRTKLTLVPSPEWSVATSWRDDEYDNSWSCSWVDESDQEYSDYSDGGSDDDGDDSASPPSRRKPPNVVFQESLGYTRCGIVRPISWDMTSISDNDAKEIYQWVSTLLEIVKPDNGTDEDGSDDGSIHSHLRIGWGDEGASEWEPFLLPWDASRPLTDTNVLKRLRAHPRLVETAHYHSSVCGSVQGFLNPFEKKEEEEDKDGRLSSLTEVFIAGSEVMNPVPCFAVAKVRDDLLAGFVGGIAHSG